MAILKKTESGGDISALKKEVDSLKKEVASLRKQLSRTPKSSGGADSRVDIIIEVLRSMGKDGLLKKKGLV